MCVCLCELECVCAMRLYVSARARDHESGAVIAKCCIVPLKSSSPGTFKQKEKYPVSDIQKITVGGSIAPLLS